MVASFSDALRRVPSPAAYEALETFGYDVTFRSFDGGHEVPPDILREVEAWMGE